MSSKILYYVDNQVIPQTNEPMITMLRIQDPALIQMYFQLLLSKRALMAIIGNGIKNPESSPWKAPCLNVLKLSACSAMNAVIIVCNSEPSTPYPG